MYCVPLGLFLQEKRMEWTLVGILLGSIITSQHPSREACEGRAVVLREKGVQNVRCGEPPSITSTGTFIIR